VPTNSKRGIKIKREYSNASISSLQNSFANSKAFGVKGIVQRKLRWVEIGNNGQILLQCWGARHSFLILKGNHLGFSLKHLPPHELILLVMWEKIGKAQKKVYSPSDLQKNMILAPIGVALNGV
jgi:hypothetical protein